MAVVITVLAALAGVAVGAWLTHGYALRRERRAELAAAIDRALHAFVAADRAVSFLIREVESAKPQGEVVAAGDKVSEYEIELRAAHTSISMRLREGHPLAGALAAAREAFNQTYILLAPAVVVLATEQWNEEADDAVAAARQQHERFRDALRKTVDHARVTIGPAD